ncbi:hypothetical protein [Lysobacter capsici]|uniref:hypothetical protein n=1 Tax=Lysobacter capsici TaxID=435897 RepID=UPI00398CA3B2
MRVIKDCLARVVPFLCCFGIGLAVLSLSRLGLVLWQADAVNDADAWSRVLLQGIRVDTATLCMLLGIASALYLLLPVSVARHALVRTAMAAWLALSLTVLVVLELATPTFMQEYGLRPNRLFLEYLIYPREVVSTLAKGHLVAPRWRWCWARSPAGSPGASPTACCARARSRVPTGARACRSPRC